MAYKKYYKKKKKYSSKNNTPDIDPVGAFVALCVLFGFGTYQKFMKGNMEMINFYAKILLLVILLFLMVYLLYRIKKSNKLKIKEVERVKSIPSFLRELESKIKEFSPSQNYKQENLYQAELVGFLKNNYPSSKVEETRDFSRPDIIIDDIAIEIKGPTNMSALKTLPDKINSYIPKWDYLFIVLFNISITDNPETNNEIYKKKKQEILENTIDSKKERVFFIEI